MALPMDKLLVTYCDCTDDANSAKMADELYKLGYDRDKVKALAGGSLKWVELKYPMVAKQYRIRNKFTNDELRELSSISNQFVNYVAIVIRNSLNSPAHACTGNRCAGDIDDGCAAVDHENGAGDER